MPVPIVEESSTKRIGVRTVPRPRNALPSYLYYKSSGQARVRIDGRDILLGPYGSEEFRIRYGEMIARLAGE